MTLARPLCPHPLPLADAPYRLTKLGDEFPQAFIEASNAAHAFIAVSFALHDTCPHRKCRDGCAAGGGLCGALFPPETDRIVQAMNTYVLNMPIHIRQALYDMSVALTDPPPSSSSASPENPSRAAADGQVRRRRSRPSAPERADSRHNGQW